MDQRNAIAKARDDWFETEDGKRALNPIPGLENQYLQNRLEMAFLAGYQAAEHGLADYVMWAARELAKEVMKEAAQRPFKYKLPFTL
jgi:hypothetical protein